MPVSPQVFTFEVGHPFAGNKTVNLLARPVNLPLGWTYELSYPSVSLDEGETAEASLTLYPSHALQEGDLLQVMVEATVDGQLVGGVLFEYVTPYFTPRPFPQVYLPQVAH